MTDQEKEINNLYTLVLSETEIQIKSLEEEKRMALGFLGVSVFLIILPVSIITGDLIMAIIMAILMYSPFFIVIYLFSIDYSKIKYLKSLQEFYKLSKGVEKRLENYNEILILLKKVKKLINKRGKIYSGSSVEIGFKINQYKYLNLVLEDLNSDLSLHLTEQQSTLEQAKSEVSTHIHGTDELNQVSELQRQRLDQQIAQFEELQRILVKV